jgi:DNA-binding MarR family transcriptional regulator
MTDEKIQNLVGALSLALADQYLQPVSAPAAALTLLSHAPGLTIDELSRVLGLSHPGAVRLVDRLASDDLVVRGRSASDGRAVALTLTAKGEATAMQILESRRSILVDALAALTPSDREAFGRIAETMLRSVVQSPDHAATICRLCDSAACGECPVEHELMSRESHQP